MAAKTKGKQTTKTKEADKAVETPAVETPASETPAAEEKKEQKNLFLNGVSESCIHDTKDPALKIVSFGYPESANGFGSITVRAGQISPAKYFHDSENHKQGEEIPGRFNVLLGKEDRNYNVSVKQADGTFAKSKLSAADIKSQYDAERNAYKQSQAEAAAPEAEAPQAENDGLEA